MHRVLVLLLTIVAGCGWLDSVDDEEPGAPPTRAADGAPIARVGDRVITDLQFAAAASRTPEAAAGGDLTARRAVLDKLISDEMLFQEAVTREVYKDPKIQKMMVSLLIREAVFDRIRLTEIPESDLEDYFETHRETFMVPEKVQVRRIFVRVGEERDLEEAKELMAGLRKQLRRSPAKFGELAENHSEDSYRRRGGDIGLVDRSGKAGVPPEVIDVAFSLGVGQLSEVFEAGGGLNLVLAVSRRDPIEREFAQMKGTVLRTMKNETFQQKTQEFVDEIRARYDVQIDEETLANTYVQVQAAAPNMNAAELLDVTAPRPDQPVTPSKPR